MESSPCSSEGGACGSSKTTRTVSSNPSRAVFSLSGFRALRVFDAPETISCMGSAYFWEGEAPSEPALFGGRVFESSEHRVC